MAGVARVLVVNAGSTSLKLSLVDEGGRSTSVQGFAPADAVGHRIVHFADLAADAVLAEDWALAYVEEGAAIAPLHNRPALEALHRAREALPDVPHVLVSDSWFHRTIPDEAAVYAVPQAWGLRRYGFHGIALQSVAEQVSVARLVACHLGGGSSVTAVLDGRSVDTTMGFTPLEGVPMATRSGSVDPGALLYVLRELGLSVDELERGLHEDSGLAALGGLDEPLGFAVFTYRVAQAVAAMAVALGGLDALAFSGGVGENRGDVRDAVCERLGFLGVGSTVAVHVVAAREELVIAREVRKLLADPH